MMHHLQDKFARMGARAKVRDALETRHGLQPVTRFGVDVLEDRKGPFFELRVPRGEGLELAVLDVRPELRHLLLMVRQEGRKDKFLCGHDERHWFTCAVPGGSVSNVKDALEALKPAEVRWSETRLALREKERLRRHNRAYRRQGEWFFVPQPSLVVSEWMIFRDEPIRRGNGKAHWCEELYRTRGVLVYVSEQHPRPLTEQQYERLLERNHKARKWDWRTMVHGANVYVRGRVSHPDHATIVLHGWHRVLMNTEGQAPGVRNVLFLD